VQSQLEDTQRRLEGLETQRRAWQGERSQHEATKSKLSQVEDRLVQLQLQQQQKRRVLQDTTNTHTGKPAAAEGLLDKGSAKNAIRGLSGARPQTMLD
jgi:hypothetical protein